MTCLGLTLAMMSKVMVRRGVAEQLSASDFTSSSRGCHLYTSCESIKAAILVMFQEGPRAVKEGFVHAMSTA